MNENRTPNASGSTPIEISFPYQSFDSVPGGSSGVRKKEKAPKERSRNERSRKRQTPATPA